MPGNTGAVSVLLPEMHPGGTQISVLLLSESGGTVGVLLRFLYPGGVQSGILFYPDTDLSDSWSIAADREKVVPGAMRGGCHSSISTVFPPAVAGNV